MSAAAPQAETARGDLLVATSAVTPAMQSDIAVVIARSPGPPTRSAG